MLWMSAFHLGADIAYPRSQVSFVPKAEVAVYLNKSLAPRNGTARHSGNPAFRIPSANRPASVELGSLNKSSHLVIVRFGCCFSTAATADLATSCWPD